MTRRRAASVAALGCFLFALCILPAFAQFTANIQGVIQDQSGAGVGKAQISLSTRARELRKPQLLILLAITAL